MIENIKWMLRHPIYAACWYMTGKTYSEVMAMLRPKPLGSGDGNHIGTSE